MKYSTEQQDGNILDKAEDSANEKFAANKNLGKRRRAIAFMLVGVWALYNYGLRDNLNLPWLLVALALIIVSAYNFKNSKKMSSIQKQVVDED